MPIASMSAFAQDDSCAYRTVPVTVEGANEEPLHEIAAAELVEFRMGENPSTGLKRIARAAVGRGN